MNLYRVYGAIKTAEGLKEAQISIVALNEESARIGASLMDMDVYAVTFIDDDVKVVLVEIKD